MAKGRKLDVGMIETSGNTRVLIGEYRGRFVTVPEMVNGEEQRRRPTLDDRDALGDDIGDGYWDNDDLCWRSWPKDDG